MGGVDVTIYSGDMIYLNGVRFVGGSENIGTSRFFRTSRLSRSQFDLIVFLSDFFIYIFFKEDS